MQTVHHGHSCMLLDTGKARLMLDPGVFSSFDGVTGLDALLITHQHADHLDPQRLPALLAANPGVPLYVDEDSAAMLTDLGYGAQTTVLRPGDSVTIAGAAVHVVGGTHAEIHPEVQVPRNNGYVIDHGAFYHPGDALHVPEQTIDVLGLPTGAPWLKLGEAVDFLRAVAPRTAVPIHEKVLSEIGTGLHHSQFGQMAPSGTMVTVLTPGQLTEV